MSLDPHNVLAKVEPDLARVLRAALQVPQPFMLVYGVRTVAAERSAVESGNSHTMHSRHLPDKHGLSAAVDVAALDSHGHIDWAKGREEEVYGQIAKQIKQAAKDLGVPLQWGGDPIGAWTPGVVSHFRDWGHYQLPWKEYP